ncbi:MAG: lipoic acid synthetase [Porticoccus sp.]|jgi:lipoic acid synthetase
MTGANTAPPKRARRIKQGKKLRSADKVERIPAKVIPTEEIQRKASTP